MNYMKIDVVSLVRYVTDAWHLGHISTEEAISALDAIEFVTKMEVIRTTRKDLSKKANNDIPDWTDNVIDPDEGLAYHV